MLIQTGPAVARHGDCLGLDIDEVDIADAGQMRSRLAAVRPALVINCAAFTDVDGAETRVAEAMRVNSQGPAVLAETYGIRTSADNVEVARQADILILDEPTAVLTPQEVEDLFKVIHSLVSQGKSVIFITHKLKEVLDIDEDYEDAFERWDYCHRLAEWQETVEGEIGPADLIRLGEGAAR